MNERTVNLHRASCTLTTADTYVCDRCAFCDTVLYDCVCQHLNWLTNLNETWYELCAIGSHPNAFIISRSVSLTAVLLKI